MGAATSDGRSAAEPDDTVILLRRQGDSFSKHRQATYFMLPVIGAR